MIMINSNIEQQGPIKQLKKRGRKPKNKISEIPQIIEELRQVFEVDTENYKSYQTVSQQILDTNCNCYRTVLVPQ